jgi:Xaa-Pro aminopeptidase
MKQYHTRIHKLQTILSEIKLPAFITGDLPSIRYLTGFSGSSAWLVITARQSIFLTDFRYQEQIRNEVTASIKIITKKRITAELAGLKVLSQINRIGFQADKMSFAVFQEFKAAVPNKKWLPLKDPVKNLRLVKDMGEIAALQKAIDITQQAFQEILPLIKPGVSEIDLAGELEYRLRKKGSPQPAFPTIVASGARSVLPHGSASLKKINHGDFVVFDFGGMWKGYCGDFTRTIVVGRANREKKKIYQTVLKAQSAALAAVRDNITARELDSVARQVIQKAGYDKYFGHGLGHGIGLEVHEDPRISQLSTDTLHTGMVHSIEPGIYVPSLGGVRIEDVVVVEKNGCRNLTNADKELIEL